MSISHSPSIATNGLVVCLDAANVKSFDYRENLIAYTEDFTNWSTNASPNGTIISGNAIQAPNGTLTADKIIRPATSGSSILYKLWSGSINTPYVGSIYLKAGELTKCGVAFDNSSFNNTLTGADVDLIAGTTLNVYGGSTVTVSHVGAGWYRITVTATSTATLGNYVFRIVPLNSAGIGTFTGDGVSGIYAWGAQVETGYVATPYTPVLGTSSITRSTTLRDIVGTNHATFNDYQIFSNNSLIFNGTSNFATIPEFGSLPVFTCEAWFKATASPGTTQGCVVSTVYGSQINYKIGWTGVGNTLNCGFYNGAWRSGPGFTVTLNQWYHTVFTYDGSVLTLYVNGVLGGSNAYIASPAAGSGGSGVRIGRRWDLAEYFTGEIPVVRIYNRPLTAAEALQNFNASRGRYGV